jgi:hypothetical protein
MKMRIQQKYPGNWKDIRFHTPGLAPSVIKMSSAFAGNPSRAAIPAAIASRSPLIPLEKLINKMKPRYILHNCW